MMVRFILAVLVCATLSAQAEWKFLDTHDKTVANAVCRGEKGPCVKFGKNDNWGYVKGWKNGDIRFENALFEDIQGSAVDILGIDGDVVFADCTFRRTSAATVAMHPDYRNAVKNGAKPKGRIVFERCRFEGWEDVPFFSAEPYPMFDVTLKDCSFVRTGKRPGSSVSCPVPAIELGSWYDFGTSDLPDALKGRFEIEGLKADGERNLVGVRDELGYTDFKGLFAGVDFSYSAPDRALPRLARVSTANLGGTGGGPAFSESPFKLTWNGSYAVKPPQYTYYFRAKKGDRVSFALAYPDGGGSKERYAGLSLKLMVPSGEERDLGPIGPGRNEFSVTAEADGWYRFSNPRQAIVPIEARLVEFKGASLAYQADTENYSLAKFLLADKSRPATGYFEVPAGTGSFRLAVLWGDLEIRNPKGEVVAAVGADDYRGRHVFDLKATSSESEVWSFTAKGPGTHVVRFHAPLTGIWADSPEALPMVMALAGCTPFQDDEKGACGSVKVVPILTARQRTHLDLPRDVRTNNYNQADYRKRLRGSDQEPGWYPEPLKLTWEGDPEATYEVTVRRTKDGSVFCRKSVKGTSCELDNFEVACRYDWTVAGGGVSHAGAFVTEDRTPRVLRVPGVPNVRDLGGYRTSYGRRVRQNRVFRSAGLNDNAYVPHGKELDKLMAAAETGPVKGALTQARRQIDAFRRLSETKEKVPYVTVDWGDGAWNVHDIVALTSSALTDAFAAGRTTEASSRATVGKDGYLRFDGTGLVALDRTFTAPDDGYMLLEATGDWYWALMLNGCLFANYYTNGNGCKFTDYHQLLLPVKKGTNKLEVVLRNGTASWCFSCRPGVPGTKDYAKRAAKRLEESLSNLFKCTGRTRIGPQNREFLLQTLGIRSDIDLRSAGECYGMTGSPLGPTVKWFHVSSECYAGFGSKGGREAFAKVFKVFLDEANYPIDFHCIAGQDRTGAVAYTLLALLGVDDEDIWKDWEASGFWNPASGWLNYNNFNRLVKVFDGYEGASTREKAERHVLSLGFTMDDIAHLRELMLEK